LHFPPPLPFFSLSLSFFYKFRNKYPRTILGGGGRRFMRIGMHAAPRRAASRRVASVIFLMQKYATDHRGKYGASTSG